MDPEFVRSVLLWCAIVNYGVLLVWFAVFACAGGWLRRLHGRWFRMPAEQFDAIHYAAMAVYKIGILLLNIVPWVALRIVA